MLNSRSLRSLHSAHILLGFSALAVLLRLAIFVVHAPFTEGDTKILVGVHTNAIRACLKEGHWLNCPDSGVWPLFQNLASLLLSYLGISSSSILHALAYLSFVSFLGLLLLIFWTLKKKTSVALAVTGALIAITSPLLWYSHSTFGEMAAAFLILAFTTACLMRAPTWLVVSLFVLAGSTKEIALPFLLIIGLLCVLAEARAKSLPSSRRVAALILAAAVTALITVAFNYFRYGTLYNSSYLTKALIVPTFKLQLSFFLGIWFSPNGGMAVFWPPFLLLYLAVLGVVVFAFVEKRVKHRDVPPAGRDPWCYIPLLTISAILFLLTVVFSRWYTPLGGFAWGPRYILPWIPALTLLLIYFYRDEVSGILHLILRQPIGFALSSLVLVMASMPQLAILFGDFVLAKIFAYPECPRVPVIQEGAAYYYQCLQTQIWPRNMVILELYRVALKTPAVWFSILYGTVLVSGLQLIRKHLLKDELHLKLTSKIASGWTATVAMLRRATERPWSHCLVVVALYSVAFVVFFFPVIYKGDLLAVVGDGLYIYLPNFYSRKVLWDTFLFSGFPMMADPQVMTWYPPAFLLPHLPGSWNVFIILAYVAGSSFTYGYVYSLTRSRLAAFTSGLIFGMSGFMMAHLGHAVIIHAAAWIPLIIWSLEEMRRKVTAKWLVIGSAAVSFSFLGGHSQIFFYGLILGAAYLLVSGWNAPAGRWRYYLISSLMLIMGTSLAAVQIIPTAELLAQSGRVGYSFKDFVSHSLPPRQALTMIFPYAFGDAAGSGGGQYFGAVNQTELAGYVGLLSLLLAAIGLLVTKRKSLSRFWFCVAVLAFLLVIGDATPLARLIYHVPILNSFRAPARHFIEMTFAVSVLAGLGVAAILRLDVSARLAWRVVSLGSLAMLSFAILLLMNSSHMAVQAREYGITQFSLLPWANRAVGIPVLIFLLGAAALIYFHKQPASMSRKILLLAVLVVDLGSFGWFYEWQYVSPDKSGLNAPEIAKRYDASLEASDQRLMPYRGPRGLIAEMPPNLTRLWGVPSAGGYNVLILSRIRKLLPMIDNIDSPLPWTEPDNKSLDLMAVRYLFLPGEEPRVDDQGVSWSKSDLQLWLGEDCNEPPNDSVTISLPVPVKSTALAVVSRLACSTQVPDGTEVVRLRLTEVNGKVQTRSLVAGRDASDWAYDCSNVKPQMRHQRAHIFRSYPAQMYDQSCEGHFYVTRLPLDGAKEIKGIQVEWVGGPGPVALILDKLSLINEVARSSHPIDPALTDSDHWRLVEETREARVYENLRPMPRAWLATEVANVTPDQALNTIKTGKLPDGRSFDPHRTALVDTPLTLNSQNLDAKASATVASLSDTHMEVRTSSLTESFLITSDAYYPGWHATVDGRETPLYRADYAIRGVVVPAGEHVVRFDYRPRTFYIGASVSAVSLLALAAVFVVGLLRRRRRT